MKRDIIFAVHRSYDYIKSVAPVDTGTLRDSIKVEKTGKNEYQIKICSPLIDYVVYTNEKWVAPRWKGRENPNEKWIDKAVDFVVSLIASLLDGEISYDHQEREDRWKNKNYWDSPEGQEKLKEYRMNDTE